MTILLPRHKRAGTSIGEGFASGFQGGMESAEKEKSQRLQGESEERNFEKRQRLISQLQGERAREKHGFDLEKIRGQSKFNLEEDERNYNFIKDKFGQQTADLYRAAPQGGKTKIIDHVIDTLQRGGDVEESISPHMKEVEDQDLGLTPKEKAKKNLEISKIERKEHHEVAKPVYQELQQIRKNIPLQQQAVEDIKNASPDVGMRDYLADIFKFEPLRTSEGVKLRTAVKDFFLSDLSRAGGRPNMFIEQQLADALPKIGRDPKANMITAAGMKFKVDLSEKRAEILDRLIEEDLENDGFVRGKTLDSRANKEMKKYVIDKQYELKNEILDIKKGKVQAGTKINADKALEFLNEFGGDRTKAEKHARDLGYEF